MSLKTFKDINVDYKHLCPTCADMAIEHTGYKRPVKIVEWSMEYGYALESHPCESDRGGCSYCRDENEYCNCVCECM